MSTQNADYVAPTGRHRSFLIGLEMAREQGRISSTFYETVAELVVENERLHDALVWLVQHRDKTVIPPDEVGQMLQAILSGEAT